MAAHADPEDAGGLLNDLWQRQQQKVLSPSPFCAHKLRLSLLG
jgi:hypothetical protein